MKNLKFFIITSIWFIFYHLAWSECHIYHSNNHIISSIDEKHDALFYLLKQTKFCPKNVIEFNQLIESAGLVHKPSMVANRGRNNPSKGSFSFFETVSGNILNPKINLIINVKAGDFFYGHFTDIYNNQVVLDQSSSAGKLLIELIAWDNQKNIFNFYELRGLTNREVRWYYRGDSLDALNDNEYLYRDSGVKPKFGSAMRCSACHNSGGPIMKELKFPHNDWWTEVRPLFFENIKFDSQVLNYLSSLKTAEYFAENVKTGIDKLEISQTYQEAKSILSLQQQLRPLFCEQEINIESDIRPNEEGNDQINIPTSFLLNPLLAIFSKNLIGPKENKISRVAYEDLLKKYKIHFPESNYLDADHAWLTPVKGYSDLLAIQSLILKNIVTLKFATTILSIDLKNPLFSKIRCDLLKFVPNVSERMENVDVWEKKILFKIDNYLSQNNLENNQITSIDFEANEILFKKLLKVRKDVSLSEISQNPLGQILEPGFRLIFPLENSK